MNDLTLFLAGSAAIVWLSRKPLRKPGSHGFYRFFAWEAILGLIVLNREVWGSDPYSPHQFASWLLMMTSVALVVIGVLCSLITAYAYFKVAGLMFRSGEGDQPDAEDAQGKGVAFA